MTGALIKLNLAQHQFQNRRPRRRLTGILWTLAGLATAWNVLLFVQYWQGSSNGRDEFRAIRSDIDQQVAGIRDLQKQLVGEELIAQNEQVRFLNRKIAERTFPWSRLFDDIVAVLPRNLRLERMAPSIPTKDKRKESEDQSTEIEWINLNLRGTAKTSEDLLDLVDAMFDSRSFAGPVLEGERDTDLGVEFDLTVRYRVALPTHEGQEVGVAVEVTEAGRPPAAESGAQRASIQTGSSPEGGQASRPADPAGASARPGNGSETLDPGLDSRPQEAAGRVANSVGSERSSSKLGGSRTLPTQNVPEANGVAGPKPAAANGSQGAPATGVAASRFRPTGGEAGPGRSGETNSPGTQRPPERVGGPGEPSAEEIADQRFGTDQPVAPRLPNASGSGNGGSR